MKNLFFLPAFLMLPYVASSQTQTILAAVKVAVDERLQVISQSWETARYISGSFKVEDSDESNPKKLILHGAIDYKSGNCGAVHTKVDVTIKKILDSFEITQTCISIPFCVWGGEYRRELKCW